MTPADAKVRPPDWLPEAEYEALWKAREADFYEMEGRLSRMEQLVGDAVSAPASGDDYTDLSWALGGVAPVIDPPVFLTRADGSALFYAGKVNVLYGDPESGKTWIAKTAVVEALADGRRVAMIDVDHNGAASTVADLLALGAEGAALADRDRFRLAEPDDGVTLARIVDDLCEWGAHLVVVDSLGEVVPMMGRSSNDNDEVTSVLRRTVAKLAEAGVCVIAIDHMAKSRENGEGFAIGAMAKKRACNGVMLLVTVKGGEPFAPGRVGSAYLTVKKDRPGRVREHAHEGDQAGTFVLDSRGAGIVASVAPVEVAAPAADGNFRPTVLMGRVSEFLAGQEVPVSAREVERQVAGKGSGLRRALEVLAMEGFAEKGAKGWVSLRPFAAAPDWRTPPPEGV